MYSVSVFLRKTSLWVFLIAALLIGCSSEPDPSLTLNEEGWWVTCSGKFTKRYSLVQQNLPDTQDVTIQLDPAMNGFVQSSISITPTSIADVVNDSVQSFRMIGDLQDRCREGRATVKADGSSGISTEGELLITPVPAIVTIEDIRTQDTDFSYTASIACCSGASDSVNVALSLRPFPTIASVDPPNPATLSLQCGANAQPETVQISGKLADATRQGRVHLYVREAGSRINCVEDTILPVSVEAE